MNLRVVIILTLNEQSTMSTLRCDLSNMYMLSSAFVTGESCWMRRAYEQSLHEHLSMHDDWLVQVQMHSR